MNDKIKRWQNWIFLSSIPIISKCKSIISNKNWIYFRGGFSFEIRILISIEDESEIFERKDREILSYWNTMLLVIEKHVNPLVKPILDQMNFICFCNEAIPPWWGSDILEKWQEPNKDREEC